MKNAPEILRRLADFIERHELTPYGIDVYKSQLSVTRDEFATLAVGHRVEVEKRDNYDWHTTTIEEVELLWLAPKKPCVPAVTVIEKFEPEFAGA